jgi:hypothetical protein
MDMFGVYDRKICKILREDFGYICEKERDIKNENFFKELSDEIIFEFIDQYDLIFINNGYRPYQRRFMDLARLKNKKIIYSELGHLPQRGSIHIDYKGLFHESSLGFDDFEWIREDDIEYAKRYIENSIYSKYLKGHKELYILCPLQMDWDSSLQGSSLRNKDLISIALARHPNEKIIFKFHPRHQQKDYDYIQKQLNLNNENISLDKTSNFLDLAVNAKYILGLSSTCLVESMAIGKPVEALSLCPIYHQNKNGNLNKDSFKEKMIAAYLKSQYTVNDPLGGKNCLDLLIKRSNMEL